MTAVANIFKDRPFFTQPQKYGARRYSSLRAVFDPGYARDAAQLVLEIITPLPSFIKNVVASTQAFIEISQKKPLAPAPAPGGGKAQKAKGSSLSTRVARLFSAVNDFICGGGGGSPGKPGFGAGIPRKRWDLEFA